LHLLYLLLCYFIADSIQFETLKRRPKLTVEFQISMIFPYPNFVSLPQFDDCRCGIRSCDMYTTGLGMIPHHNVTIDNQFCISICFVICKYCPLEIVNSRFWSSEDTSRRIVSLSIINYDNAPDYVLRN